MPLMKSSANGSDFRYFCSQHVRQNQSCGCTDEQRTRKCKSALHLEGGKPERFGEGFYWVPQDAYLGPSTESGGEWRGEHSDEVDELHTALSHGHVSAPPPPPLHMIIHTLNVLQPSGLNAYLISLLPLRSLPHWLLLQDFPHFT